MQVVEYTAEKKEGKKTMFPDVFCLLRVVFPKIKTSSVTRVCVDSSTQLFLRVWLVPQQGVDLRDSLRGHLG